MTAHRSFADPETHFHLVRSDTPVNVDGLKLGEPTGEVECDECGMVSGAPEYIPHLPHCSQGDVRSEWWFDTHTRNRRD